MRHWVDFPTLWFTSFFWTNLTWGFHFDEIPIRWPLLSSSAGAIEVIWKKEKAACLSNLFKAYKKNPPGQICCTFLFSEKQPVVSIVTKNAGETEGTQKTSCLKNIISVAISRGESPLRTKEVCHFFGTIRKFLMLQYNILTFCPLCNHFMVSSKGGFSCGCNILRMRHWSLSWLPAWTPRSWLPKMAAVESVRWEWLWPNPIEPGFWLRLQFSNSGPRWNETRSFRNGSQQTLMYSIPTG